MTLSQKATAAVTVRFSTSNGTATSGSDFRATTGSVTIPAGSTTGVASVPCSPTWSARPTSA